MYRNNLSEPAWGGRKVGRLRLACHVNLFGKLASFMNGKKIKVLTCVCLPKTYVRKCLIATDLTQLGPFFVVVGAPGRTVSLTEVAKSFQLMPVWPTRV